MINAQLTSPVPTRQNCPVSVVSASAMWTGFSTTQDCHRQIMWSLNTLIPIVQFTSPHQTRHSATFLSCLVWRCESSRPDRQTVWAVYRKVRSVSALRRDRRRGDAGQRARTSALAFCSDIEYNNRRCKPDLYSIFRLLLTWRTARRCTGILANANYSWTTPVKRGRQTGWMRASSLRLLQLGIVVLATVDFFHQSINQRRWSIKRRACASPVLLSSIYPKRCILRLRLL